MSGKLGFGFVTTYMPDALIRGFTTGAATHVVISQTSNVLGIKITRQNGALKAIMVLSLSRFESLKEPEVHVLLSIVVGTSVGLQRLQT